MKKKFIIASTAFFLIVTPAYASQSQKSNEHANQENNGQIVAGEHRENDKNNNESPALRNATQVTEASLSTPDVTTTTIPSPSPKSEDIDGNHNDKSRVQGANISVDGCGVENTWKNHGEYVSCVAREHLGGKAVSEAAKSEIGKKEEKHDGDDDDLSITPSVSPSATPSISPTITPPLTSPEKEIHFGFLSWEELRKAFEQFFRGFHFGKNK